MSGGADSWSSLKDKGTVTTVPYGCFVVGVVPLDVLRGVVLAFFVAVPNAF